MKKSMDFIEFILLENIL